MVTRKRKEELVAELVEKFQRANGIFVCDFQKMTVAQSIALRRAFREKGIEYKVAKNTLILRALKEVVKHNIPEDKFAGQSAIAFGFDDPIAPVKIIKEFFDKSEKPTLKAASIEGQYFDGSQLKMLASLPSKNELIAGILGSINAPASGIVGAINAVMRDLAYVIEEVAKKNEAA